MAEGTENSELITLQVVTSFHAKFWAYQLTSRAPADDVSRLAGALVEAQVALNPDWATGLLGE